MSTASMYLPSQDHQHLYKVRHLTRHILFDMCEAKYLHSFTWFTSLSSLFFCKIVTISLAYYLKQNECFAWICALTFVEFCKCEFSEGYCYF